MLLVCNSTSWQVKESIRIFNLTLDIAIVQTFVIEPRREGHVPVGSGSEPEAEPEQLSLSKEHVGIFAGRIVLHYLWYEKTNIYAQTESEDRDQNFPRNLA